MDFFIKKICVCVIKICSLCILCIPLVVVPATLYPYVFPKVIFFHILVEIALLAWIPLLFLNKKYHPPFRHSFVASLSIFITLLIVTALTGIDPYRSIFSTQERMTGVFTMVHFYVWFLMMISVFKTYKEWRKLLFVTIGISVLIALFSYVKEDTNGRASSTIGNALFFGSYVLSHIFLVFFLLFRETYKKRYGVFFFFVLLLFVCALFFSGSRMITVSLFFGLLLFGASYLFFHFSKKIKSIYIACACLGLLIGGILFVNGSSVGNTWAKKQLSYPVQRVFLFENYKKFQGARFEAWRIGLDGFRERPFLGWGLENYPYIFQKEYRHSIVDEGEGYADRSHNQYIDILALTGIVGFFSYLVLFAVLFLFLIRKIIKEKHISRKLAGVSLCILFMVYLLQDTTSFDTPAPLIILYFSFALAYFFISEQNDTEKNSDDKKIPRKFHTIAYGVEVVLIVFVLYAIQKWSIIPFVKNTQAKVAVTMAKERGLDEETLSYFRQSLDADSFTNYETRAVFAQSIGNLYMEKRAVSKDFARQAVESAIAQLDRSIASRPLDVKNYFLQLLLYRVTAPYDAHTLEKIEQRMRTAYTLAPYRPEIYREFPEIYIALNDFDKAEEWIRKGAKHFVPSQQTHWQLALVFLQKGDIENGVKELTEAEHLGYPVFENPNSAILLSKKLMDGKKNPSALQYIDSMARMYPDNQDMLNAQREAHIKTK